MPWQMTSLTRRAQGLGEAAVAERGGVGAVVAHVVVRDPVQLVRRDARRDVLARPPPSPARRYGPRSASSRRSRRPAPRARCTAWARACRRTRGAGSRPGTDAVRGELPGTSSDWPDMCSESNQWYVGQHGSGKEHDRWLCSRSDGREAGRVVLLPRAQEGRGGPGVPRRKDRFGPYATARRPSAPWRRRTSATWSGRTTPAGTTAPRGLSAADSTAPRLRLSPAAQARCCSARLAARGARPRRRRPRGVVGHQLRQRQREQPHRRDAGEAARPDRRSRTEVSAAMPPERTWPSCGPTRVRQQLDAGQPAAQLVRDGLVPHRGAEDAADHVAAARDGEEEQHQPYVRHPSRGRHRRAPAHRRTDTLPDRAGAPALSSRWSALTSMEPKGSAAYISPSDHSASKSSARNGKSGDREGEEHRRDVDRVRAQQLLTAPGVPAALQDAAQRRLVGVVRRRGRAAVRVPAARRPRR